MSNAVITKLRRKKLVMASAGEISLPKIVGMVFGDGGVDDLGAVIPPSVDQTELNNELHRQEIDSYTFPDDTTCRYKCTLSEFMLPNAEISEIGLYDEDGDIVCIKSFLKKGKDSDFEMVFVLDDMFDNKDTEGEV